MLLDSASLYFRAFFGVPADVKAPDGTQVNAVRGFLDMIATLVDGHRPTRLVACWDDDWRPAWRVALIPSYKTARVAADVDPAMAAAGSGVIVAEEVPDELSHQVPIIAEVLAALGIARVGASGCEADDVIGTLATRSDEPVDIVTGDRDLFQLVDDERGITVWFTGGRSGVRNRVGVNSAELQARYGISRGDQYADLAVLRGDPSDGIPGVPGIGEKTASSLISTYGDLAGVLRASLDPTAKMPAGQRAKLAAAVDYLRVAPAVVRVHRDADLPAVDDTMPREPRHPEQLAALAERWGLGSSIERVTTALAG